MMKVAVLDDSAADVRAVLGMLGELASRVAVPFSAEAFSDPFALLDAVQEKGGFDLYLLDIIMPVMSGMEVASRIRRRGETCEIVFLTTSREYGVEAFGVRAAGYLLKPVDRVRLEDVLRAAFARLDAPGGKPVVVRTGGGLRKVLTSEIGCIESFNHRREILLSDGSRVVTPETLERFRQLLADEPGFYAPHRTYIVNLDYVTGIQDGDVLIRGAAFPVAKKSYRKFMEYYLDYCFKK